MAVTAKNALHIAGMDKDSLEPQRKNNYEIVLEPPDGGGDEISLTLQTFSFPAPTTEIIEVHFQNDRAKYPGLTTFADIELTVLDTVASGAALVLWEWYQKVVQWTEDTGPTIGFAKNFKTKGTLILFGPDLVTKSRSWDLINMWPVAFKPDNMEFGTADPVNIGVTFAVDRVVPKEG